MVSQTENDGQVGREIIHGTEVPAPKSGDSETDCCPGALKPPAPPVETLERKPRSGCLGQAVTVEAVLFLFNMASQMVWITSQDLMLKKACSINFGYPDYMCENLSDYDEEEVAVQEMVSNFLMWRSIFETSIKLLSVPLIGWWGDKRGRKGPLILSLLGLGLESTTFLVNSVASEWPLEAVFCSSLFYGISGGTHTLLMLSFSFMAEKTSTRNRTLRMSVLDGFYYLGSPVGLAIASPLFRVVGYGGMFGICAFVYAFAIFYVVVRIPKGLSCPQTETHQPEEGEMETCVGVSRITDAFFTTFERRPGRLRTFILVAIFAMMLDSFVIWGESNVKYLFVQRALDWDYTKYNHYGTASSLLSVVGALVLVPVITLNTALSDAFIGIIGAASRTLERVFYVFANAPSRGWLMYAGGVFGIGAPMAPIAIRSLLSKLAKEDVGQVYAVMAVGESLLPFVSAPTYNSVYESTVESFPGAFYLFSIAFNLLLGLCFLYISVSTKLQSTHSVTE